MNHSIEDPIAELIRAGAHREAVALCARRHTGTIGRLCMALLGDQAEAEEATQETLLSAHRAMDQFRGDGSVKGWLLKIARRICVRRLQTRSRRERRIALVHDAGVERDGPDDLVEIRRRAHEVREALATLKPSEREIVLLRFHSGLTFREVAEISGIEEAAARKRASRALAKLRDLLSDVSDDQAAR